jgi:hypothetical protein
MYMRESNDDYHEPNGVGIWWANNRKRLNGGKLVFFMSNNSKRDKVGGGKNKTNERKEGKKTSNLVSGDKRTC